eukprot:5582515-Amphidinium_carterae.1
MSSDNNSNRNRKRAGGWAKSVIGMDSTCPKHLHSSCASGGSQSVPCSQRAKKTPCCRETQSLIANNMNPLQTWPNLQL